MTVLGQTELPLGVRRQIARLIQLHQQTHPERLARIFGVSAKYAQYQWRVTALYDMAPLREALVALYDHEHKGDTPTNGSG